MINKRFLLWFTLAILLVTIVGITAYSSLRKQAEQEHWVEHTYQIITGSGQLSKLIIDMETAQRGFRATGDTNYLINFQSSANNLTNSIDSLKGAILTNGEEVVHIDRLRETINSLEQFWQSQSTSSKKMDIEQNRVITAHEKELAGRVLAGIDVINAAAQNLLAVRQAEKEKTMRQAVLTVGIGTILILLVVAGLIRLMILEHRSRAGAESKLNDKYDELNKLNEVTGASNWLLDGIRLINDSLMGNDTLEELVQNCLDALAAYLQLPCAVCYTFDKDKQELECIGSVALTGAIGKKIKLGEGLAGAAAKRKHLTVIDSIPAGYWQIVSATGMALPDTLVFLPLWKKNELIGVLEFGCFGAKVDKVNSLLQDMALNIALGISAAQLLSLTQGQRDVLDAQQEELRISNDELGLQAEELRVKEEELTRINQILEEKTESLEVAGVEMQKKAADLELSGKYKSEFLANMSHELRTPLNSILILTALMQENKDKNLTDRQQENLRIVNQSGSDLLNLINDVLDLSKIEAGKVDFMMEQLAISVLANDMEQAFNAVATKKHIRFDVSVKDLDGIAIQTDRQRLGQVIKNLLSNAFKFTPDGGEVSLRFTRNAETLNISVTDTGIGIPPEKQQMIFEAFQQADGSTNRRYGGTGLGLSISKELVSRLGGSISVHSIVGQGSTFTIILPLNIDGEVSLIAPESTIHEQTQIQDDRTALIPSQRSVLIIEDDVNFARAVNDFAVDRGFKTIIALSGDEGLFYARKYRPSAIILDLSLPVLSGQHILKTIKSDPELQHIPVHVISAMDGTDLPATQIEGFVQKPVKSQELAFTFSSIETYILQHYKKVLLLSNADSALRPFMTTLARSKFPDTIFDITDNFEHALLQLTTSAADCLIVDIGLGDESALQQLKQLRNAAPKVHIIACFDQPLSPAITGQFKPYADALIDPSAQAGSRLLDEVELFLHRMNEPSSVQVPEQFNDDTQADLNGKTILVADDDMRNIYALSALLEGHGVNVITAEHGKEALDLLAQNPETDLVLMDIMMPEMDGYEAMRHIRANPKYTKLPVIALTAKAMLGDREKCLLAGASDYITKPVNNQQLLSLLRVWLAAK